MKNINRVVSAMVALFLIVSLTACTSTKSERTLYDYCPKLDDFVEILAWDGMNIWNYTDEEADSYASWSCLDQGVNTLAYYTDNDHVFRVRVFSGGKDQLDNLYECILPFIKMLPGSVCSKEELEKEFSFVMESTIEDNNLPNNGGVLYCDNGKFSKDGITYTKHIERTSTKGIYFTSIDVECENIIINPYEYQKRVIRYFHVVEGAVLHDSTNNKYGYLDSCRYTYKCETCGEEFTSDVMVARGTLTRGFRCPECKANNRVKIIAAKKWIEVDE